MALPTDAVTICGLEWKESDLLRLFRLWRLAARDVRVLWYALHHARRPAWLWPAVIILGCYAVEPFNFEIPLLGVVDDFILLPLLLHLVVKLLPEEIRRGYDAGRA